MTKIRNPDKEESKIIKENYRYNPETGRVWKREVIKGKDRWSLADKVKQKGYRNVRITQIKRTLRAHRVAYFLHEGVWPELLIDHIDRKKDNNKWDNLRQVTPKQNSLNSEQQGKLQKWIKPDGSFREVPMVGEYTMHLRYRESQDRWLLETKEGKTTIYLRGFKTEKAANLFIKTLTTNWIKERIKNRRRKY